MGNGVEGVEVSDVVDDPSPVRASLSAPAHPDADKEGYVVLSERRLDEGKWPISWKPFSQLRRQNIAAIGIGENDD